MKQFQRLVNLALMLAVMLAMGLVVGLVTLARPAAAQAYPDRIVTIVAPSAPGGLYSLFARVIASGLEQRLGRTFVVENRPGATSVLGAAAVAHAAPDGYTLMIASGATLAVNVTLHKHLPYDPIADFVPIALIARVPEALVVNGGLPVRSLADLVAFAKGPPPRPLTFASAGAGTGQHLEGELLKQALALDMTHVPYKGALPAITDVAGGHVTMMFTPIPNALPLIASGKVSPIAIAGRDRVAALPSVAPLAEMGLPGFNTSTWFMLVAPAATPRPIVERLHDEARGILADPALRQRFIEEGLVPVATPSVDELKTFVRDEIAFWDKTLHRIGLAGME